MFLQSFLYIFWCIIFCRRFLVNYICLHMRFIKVWLYILLVPPSPRLREKKKQEMRTLVYFLPFPFGYRVICMVICRVESLTGKFYILETFEIFGTGGYPGPPAAITRELSAENLQVSRPYQYYNLAKLHPRTHRLRRVIWPFSRQQILWGKGDLPVDAVARQGWEEGSAGKGETLLRPPPPTYMLFVYLYIYVTVFWVLLALGRVAKTGVLVKN